MKSITIETIFGTFRIELTQPDAEGKRAGSITSMLNDPDDEQEDAAITAIESLILAHACAGVDVESDAYIEGIETALEAIDNNP